MSKSIIQNKKRYFINGVIVVLVTALSLFYLFYNNKINISGLKKIGFLSIMVPTLINLTCTVCCAFIGYIIFRKNCPKWRFYNSFIDCCHGNLGSKVTPYKLGHFPFRFYYQLKKEMPFYQSLSKLTKMQIILSFSSFTFYGVLLTLLLITKTKIDISGTTIYCFFPFLLGFLFHLGATIACLILAFCKPIQNIVISLIAKILVKFKKTHNVDEFISNQRLKMSVYKEQVLEIVKYIYKYIPLCLLYVFQLFVYGIIPYICYLIVSNNSFNFTTCAFFYTLFIIMNYSNNLLPIPGGSGSAEIIFQCVFSIIIDNVFLGATLLCWRFATFYIPVIVEFTIFLINAVFIKKKSSTYSKTDKTQTTL